MRANNLQGDYCQTCASILDEAQRNHRNVVVLDSQCAAVYHQSGDAARMLTTKHEAPEIPSHAHKAETMHHKEAVNVSPKEAALRTTPNAKHRQKRR